MVHRGARSARISMLPPPIRPVGRTPPRRGGLIESVPRGQALALQTLSEPDRAHLKAVVRALLLLGSGGREALGLRLAIDASCALPNLKAVMPLDALDVDHVQVPREFDCFRIALGLELGD